MRKFKQNEVAEGVESLRNDIASLQAAVGRLIDSGARQKTVLVLLAHHTKISQRTIKKVLEGVESLEAEYFGTDEV